MPRDSDGENQGSNFAWDINVISIGACWLVFFSCAIYIKCLNWCIFFCEVVWPRVTTGHVMNFQNINVKERVKAHRRMNSSESMNFMRISIISINVFLIF